MPVPVAIDEHSSYPARLFALVSLSLSQLVRPPSHARRAEAARKLARHSLLAIVVIGGLIVVLMAGFDAREIGMMPPRGTPGLGPVRILTDFGKDSYVLSLLAAMLVAVALVAATLRGTSQARLLGVGLPAIFVFRCGGTAAARRAFQMDRRSRPPLRRGPAQSFQLRPFRRDRSLCKLPIGACDYGVCFGFRGKRGLAAGAGLDGGLCARHRRHSPGALGPSPKRRRCGRADWRDRRHVRAILLRRPPFGIRHQPRRFDLAACPGARQKGCPRRTGLIRSKRRTLHADSAGAEHQR
jgi:hypothetical protein